MTGNSIHNHNHIRKKKSQGKDTAAAETITQVDAGLENESEKYKISKQDNTNSEHVTVNHLTQTAKLYISICANFGLSHKIHIPMDCNSLYL